MPVSTEFFQDLGHTVLFLHISSKFQLAAVHFELYIVECWILFKGCWTSLWQAEKLLAGQAFFKAF